MEPIQTLVLLIAAGLHNASLGQHNSTQFITELGKWADDNIGNATNYFTEGEPAATATTTTSANLTDLDEDSHLISKRIKWEYFVESRDWDLFDKSVDKDVKVCYVIYSFLHNFSVLLTYANIFEDVSVALANEEQKVRMSSYVTQQILVQTKDDQVLTFEKFEEQFTQDYNRIKAHLETRNANKKRNDLFRFLFQGLGALIIGLFGVIGNIVSIIVLSSPKLKSSFSILLMGLATSDSIVLLHQIVFKVIPILSSSRNMLDSWILNIFSYIFRSGQYGSMFFTMVITVERYIVVCHPLAARSIGTWKKSVVTVGMIFILANLVNVPYLILYSCRMHPDYHRTEGNHSSAYCTVNESSEGHQLFIPIVVHANTVFLFVLPVLVLIISNGLIYFKIRESNALRKSMTNSSTSSGTTVKENNLTTVLFAIGIIFMLTNIPLRTFQQIKYILRRELPYRSEIESTFIAVYYLQFALNFLIYFGCGTAFRNIFSEIFCGWRKVASIRGNNQSTTTDDTSEF